MPFLKTAAKRIYGRIPFKRQLYTAIRAWVDVPEPLHRHLHFTGPFTVAVGPSARFKINHYGYMIENELFWQGITGWEKVSMELWIRLCREARLIIDIGANTGVYALVAQAVNPMAEVIAVEPVARVFDKLQANVALNGNKVRSVNAAVSDHTGTATLFDRPDSEHVFSVSLDPEWNRNNPALRPVEVPCVTVAGLVEDSGATAVDLLKIDVETHEPAVLRGFKALLERDRPSLLIEILNDRVAEQITELIHGMDYVYYNIDERAWPPQRVGVLSPSTDFNFLICRPEVALALGLGLPSA